MGVNVVVSVVSVAGAVGFLVVADSWRALTGDDRRLGATSKVILRTTLAIIFLAFLLILFTDEAVKALPPTEQVLSAFFQAMTASTTVGFNTFPIGGLAMSSVVVLMLLMIVGASPAGTGGGLKTTTFAALWALVSATLQRSPTVVSFGRELPQRTVNTVSATLVYYCGLLLAAMVLVTNFDPPRQREGQREGEDADVSSHHQHDDDRLTRVAERACHPEAEPNGAERRHRLEDEDVERLEPGSDRGRSKGQGHLLRRDDGRGPQRPVGRDGQEDSDLPPGRGRRGDSWVRCIVRVTGYPAKLGVVSRKAGRAKTASITAISGSSRMVGRSIATSRFSPSGCRTDASAAPDRRTPKILAITSLAMLGP